MGRAEPATGGGAWNTRVLLACGILAGLFAAGSWGVWPAVAEDAARTEPWRLALSLTGEACGLLGLVVFAWRHGVRGAPVAVIRLPPAPGDPPGRRSAVWALTWALLGGLLGDAAVTGSTLLEEWRGHRRAVAAGPLDADAVVVRCRVWPGHKSHWRLRVAFRGHDGRPHAGLLSTIHRPGRDRGGPGGFQPRLSPAAGNPGPPPGRALLDAGRNGVGTRVRVRALSDPHRPARVWAPGGRWLRADDATRIFLGLHLIQAIAVAAVLLGARESAGPSPPVAPVLPFAFEAVVLALLGMIWRAAGGNLAG